MAKAVHVRLDARSESALEVMKAGGITESEAVRRALCEAAAHRRAPRAIREEARQLAGDEADRTEMRLIREQLAELAPSRPS